MAILIFFLPLLAAGLVAGIHLVLIGAARRGWVRKPPIFLSFLLLALLGAFIFATFLRGWPPLLLGSGLLFYAASCLVYIQVRLLLCRGYSLRMLLDLKERGGRLQIEELKSTYGRGMGLQGLLLRRINDLAKGGFLRLDGDNVTSLTSRGRFYGRFGLFFRRLLKLEQVG